MELTPVVPFEPVSAVQIPHGEQWIAQVKWDGVRVLTYYDGHSVRLYNRRQHERTVQFPEFVEIRRFCTASSIILDGEIIAFRRGKPSFHEVMKRDGIRQPEKVGHVRKAIPLVYMIFDVLYFNGEWIIGRTLEERQEILNRCIVPQEDVQLVENFREAEILFDVIKAQGLEGIVCKDISSRYTIKGKDGRWRKLKNYRDLVAVIGGATYRGNIINAVLLGLYDRDGQLWYIGHAGTGKLTRVEWRDLTERIKPLVSGECPFVNKPARVKNVTWVKPELTAKIRYIEWTEGHTLRQPSIQAFVEIPPAQCIFEQS